MDRPISLGDVFHRTWWTFRPDDPDWFDAPYHYFNLFEGTAWVVFSTLVLRRYLAHRHSRIEIVYAIAFFTFGLTDFREAYALSSWLVWAKGINLVVLLALRSFVIARHYPDSKLY